MNTRRLSFCRRSFLAAVVVPSAMVGAQAQPVEGPTLAAPAAALETPFTSVAAIRELRDGGVLVLDVGEGRLLRVESDWLSVVQVGRDGDGPGEYRAPISLLALPGDSSALRDWGNSRLLVITPAGEAGGFLDHQVGSGCRGNVVRPRVIIATDTLGAYYVEADPVEATPGGLQPTDSAAIERWIGCQADTVGFVPNKWGGRHRTRVLGSGAVTAAPDYTRVPFEALTTWTVAADGRVAIVRPEPYRVDYIDAAGRRYDGPPLEYERIRVDDRWRARWREEANAPAPAITVTRQSSAVGLQRRPFVEPRVWPQYLPPFLVRQSGFVHDAAIFAPDGRLWIRRTTRLDQAPAYDVVDEAGRVVDNVSLRARSRVVGFGKAAVYVVRSDSSDLEYLEKYLLRGRIAR